MIRSFASVETQELFITGKSRRWNNNRKVALRKLDQLHAAVLLVDLSVPPGNRLEAFQGSRKGQHSIRIDDQWRICFFWKMDGVHAVAIVNYH